MSASPTPRTRGVAAAFLSRALSHALSWGAMSVVLALLLVGCGSGGDSEPEVNLEGAQTATQGSVSGGDSGDDSGEQGGGNDEIPPDPGGGGVSIDVATLPFGGAAEPTGALTQCVTVGWNGDVVVPDGATLSIAVRLDSDLLALYPAACDGIDGPACDGLEVTGRPGPCTIGVTATRAPADGEPAPSTLMSGRLTCDEAAAAACEQAARELEGSVTTIQFALPPPEELPPAPETE